MPTRPHHGHHGRTVLVVLLAAIVLLAACGSDSKKSSSKKTDTSSGTTPAKTKDVTVTLIGSFTGQFASSSVSIQKSLEYGFAQVNAGTAPVKAPGFNFKVAAADDGGVPSKALDLARTASSNGSNIVFTIGHAEVDAVKPLADTGKLLGTEADPPDVSADGTKYPYQFDFYTNNINGITAQMKLAASKSLKKFAVVAGAGDQYQGYVDDVTKTLGQDAGASVVLTQRFDPTTSDFSSIVTKIKQAGADSIWFFSAGPTVQQFFQALQSANVQVPIFNAFGSLTCAACFTMPPTFLSHVFLAAPKSVALDASGNPALPGFGDTTKALWTSRNLTSLTDKATANAGGVDYAYVIAQMVKNAGGDDPAKLKAAFEATDGSGGVGFLAPEIKYKWSKTDHGGFPEDQVVPVSFGFSPTWPGFYKQAS